MKLAIDAGNTRAKWKAVIDGKQASAGSFTAEELSGFIEWLRLQGDVDAYIAEVGGSNFAGQLKALLPSLSLQELRSTSRLLGVDNCYEEPERLGVDRFLAAIEAWNLSSGKAVCVFDIGTAATVDVVDAAGRHCGGYIVPGLGMLRSSLLQSTDKVRFQLSGRPCDAYGQSTVEAVENGTWLMLRAWAEKQVQLFLQRYPGGQVYLTGGDASVVKVCMPQSVICHPDLVLDALLRLAEQ